MQRIRPGWLLALLGAGTVAGSGCNGLSYDRQAMAFTFPPAKSEIRVLLVYEGLRVKGDKPDDLAKAKGQLADLFADRQEFWLGESWTPLRFSLRATQPPKNDRTLEAVVRAHVVVDRAEFFTSVDGRLCAWQTLTVKDTEHLVSALNALMTATMAEKARENAVAPGRDAFLDIATEQLIQQACRGKYEWFQIEPGRLSVTFPASPAFACKMKSEVLGLKQLDALEGAARGGMLPANEKAGPLAEFLGVKARLDDLTSLPISFDQRRDRVTVSLGYGQGEPIKVMTLSRKVPPPTELDKEFGRFARQLRVPLQHRVEIPAFVEGFCKGVLPDREK